MELHLARLLSTCFGLGYVPFAPGTVVSLVALLAYLYLPPLRDIGIMTVAVLLAVVAGVWSGSVMEETYGQDPSIVTLDELAGQWVALAALPASPLAGFLAFILFRFFDIAKPGPVDRAQRFPGGWGIMADDLLAGLLANFSTRAVLAIAAYFQIDLPL
ncbi:MAG: phosphatidylglycerophosphatase A [Chlorobi bacterium]|nr:phosphatidylglycerophosphatase A [Chlorobiota bacterium]